MTFWFWSKVDIGGDDECWPWTGLRNRQGYGRSCFRGEQLTHRIAYMLCHGPFPAGKRICILHRCDNPPCCNPAHLVAGTDFQNMRDAIAKGRKPMKLTDADVREIRLLRAEGALLRVLAERFNVSVTAISNIVNYRERTQVL